MLRLKSIGDGGRLNILADYNKFKKLYKKHMEQLVLAWKGAMRCESDLRKYVDTYNAAYAKAAAAKDAWLSAAKNQHTTKQAQTKQDESLADNFRKIEKCEAELAREQESFDNMRSKWESELKKTRAEEGLSLHKVLREYAKTKTTKGKNYDKRAKKLFDEIMRNSYKWGVTLTGNAIRARRVWRALYDRNAWEEEIMPGYSNLMKNPPTFTGKFNNSDEQKCYKKIKQLQTELEKLQITKNQLSARFTVQDRVEEDEKKEYRGYVKKSKKYFAALDKCMRCLNSWADYIKVIVTLCKDMFKLVDSFLKNLHLEESETKDLGEIKKGNFPSGSKISLLQVLGILCYLLCKLRDDYVEHNKYAKNLKTSLEKNMNDFNEKSHKNYSSVKGLTSGPTALLRRPKQRCLDVSVN